MTALTPSTNAMYQIANGQIGYHEGSNNQNKYAPVVGVANNQAWCTTFVSWLFLTAGFKSLCLMSDYSVDQLNWFQNKGRASEYPAVGAVVWFGPGGENHTGWVYAYDATYIYTIEGNYNNEVNFHKRLRAGGDDPSIGDPYMYGLPNFAEGIVSADPSHTVAGSTYSSAASVLKSVPTIPPVEVPPVTTPPATTQKTYTVKSGDTWASIATANDVLLPDLLVWNNVKPTAGSSVKVGPVVTTTPPPATDYTVYPGATPFVLGASSGYVTQLTTWLKDAGGTVPVTSTFSTVVKSEVQAYQTAQGWSGDDADGIPGADTWSLLKSHTGASLPSGGTTTPAPGAWVNTVAINDKTGVTFGRYNGGGSVASWIAGACKARGIVAAAAVAAWTKGYQTAIARESSGDANACNLNDSNAVTPAGYSKVADYGNGYPGGNLNGKLEPYQASRGVAQCIPQTFAAYHCPGTSGAIYDPVANIAASIGYVVSQYGVAHDGSNLASKVQQFDPNRSPKGY